MVIRFLAFDGCPLAESARENLKTALDECGIDDFEEIDILGDDVPDDLRGWGSPTILANGEDVTGMLKGTEPCCRIYPYVGGVPDTLTIIEGIKAALSADRSPGRG